MLRVRFIPGISVALLDSHCCSFPERTAVNAALTKLESLVKPNVAMGNPQKLIRE